MIKNRTNYALLLSFLPHWPREVRDILTANLCTDVRWRGGLLWFNYQIEDSRSLCVRSCMPTGETSYHYYRNHMGECVDHGDFVFLLRKYGPWGDEVDVSCKALEKTLDTVSETYFFCENITCHLCAVKWEDREQS